MPHLHASQTPCGKLLEFCKRLGRIKLNRDIAIYFNNTDWISTEGCPNARFEDCVLTDSNENNWTWKEGFSAAWAGAESFDPNCVAAHSLLMENSEDSEKKLVMSLKSYDNRTDKYCFYYDLADLTCVLCAEDVTLQIPTSDS